MGIFSWLFGKKKEENLVGSYPNSPRVKTKNKKKNVKKATTRTTSRKSAESNKRRKLSSEMPKAKKPRIKRSSGVRRDPFLYDDDLIETFEDELDNGHRGRTGDTPVVVEDTSRSTSSSWDSSGGGWSSDDSYGGGSSDYGGGCDD